MELALSNQCFLSREPQKNDREHFHESGREKKSTHEKKKVPVNQKIPVTPKNCL